MLPTNRTAALTPQSTLDYLSLASREPSLPSTLGDFLDLLGPSVRTDPVPAAQALSTVIRHLQAGAPEGPSIRLWLLVVYAPGLQALSARYCPPGERLEEVASTAGWAFLETLEALGAERLANPWLPREIERDTRRRLVVLLGLRDYQRDSRLEERPDETLMEDQVRDDREDAYQGLEERIQEMRMSESERTLLVGLHVYGYSLQEMAAQLGQDYRTVRQRHLRLMNRLRKNQAQ
jgi:hypothetical protein